MHDFSPRHRFSDWPNKDIPTVAAGVYAIWEKDELIYCGMSGRELEKAVTSGRTRYGLVTRLEAHRNGRLSGDQFCVYIANRRVIPALTVDQLERFRHGELNLDALSRDHIREHLEYQFMIVESSKSANELERQCRRGEVFGVKPILNPL